MERESDEAVDGTDDANPDADQQDVFDSDGDDPFEGGTSLSHQPTGLSVTALTELCPATPQEVESFVSERREAQLNASGGAGQPTAPDQGPGGGGGCGGTILLEAPSITILGEITVEGGRGGDGTNESLGGDGGSVLVGESGMEGGCDLDSERTGGSGAGGAGYVILRTAPGGLETSEGRISPDTGDCYIEDPALEWTMGWSPTGSTVTSSGSRTTAARPPPTCSAPTPAPAGTCRSGEPSSE